MKKYTIADFNCQFPDDDAALEHIVTLLYPDGITCRKCQKVRPHHKLSNRKAYSCAACGTHVYPLAGTIFEKSRTPLKSWLYAIYLMASTRCGISAKQLERELGVTYKTAWRMFTQIRKLLTEDVKQLEGVVEVDETYMGGDRPGSGQPGRPNINSNKKPVVGVVQRKGKIVAKTVQRVNRASILPIIEGRVLPSANKAIYTDDLSVYSNLSKLGYNHELVKHSAKVYVAGEVHTNTIEGFWSQLKRSIDGAHHSISPKYLQSYVDKYAFRYNHRDDEQPMFATITDRVTETRGGLRWIPISGPPIK